MGNCPEKFKVQSLKFKSKGRHELFGTEGRN
jgi:hypothetical protein